MGWRFNKRTPGQTKKVADIHSRGRDTLFKIPSLWMFSNVPSRLSNKPPMFGLNQVLKRLPSEFAYDGCAWMVNFILKRLFLSDSGLLQKFRSKLLWSYFASVRFFRRKAFHIELVTKYAANQCSNSNVFTYHWGEEEAALAVPVGTLIKFILHVTFLLWFIQMIY